MHGESTDAKKCTILNEWEAIAWERIPYGVAPVSPIIMKALHVLILEGATELEHYFLRACLRYLHKFYHFIPYTSFICARKQNYFSTCRNVT